VLPLDRERRPEQHVLSPVGQDHDIAEVRQREHNSLIAPSLLPIGILSQLVSLGTLLAFVLVSIGVLILRRARPELPRPFRTPWTPWVPIFAAAVCLLQMAVLPAATWIRLMV
jgi:amino acid transporter